MVTAFWQRRIRHPRRKTARQNRAVFTFAEFLLKARARRALTDAMFDLRPCWRQALNAAAVTPRAPARAARPHLARIERGYAQAASAAGSNFRRGARRSRLHLHGEFGHVAKTLGGIFCDRTGERGLQPGRQVGAQGGKRRRPVPARRADGVGIAVRVFAGEGAEHGDAERIDVGRLVAGFAVKHFRRHVGGRAGNVLRRGILQSGNAHHPEIDQLQRSFALEDHVVRLDVAMDDAGAVQRRCRARQLDRDVASFLQTQARERRESRVSSSSPW